MNSTVYGWLSIAIALVCGVGGWIAIGAVELGASDSLTEANEALETVERSLRSSLDVANSTADALDAAAASVDAAAEASATTADVAGELSSVAGALPPVLEAVSDGINDVNGAVGDINAVLDDLPFGLGIETFDPSLTDIDPFLADLREAEVALEQLAVDAVAVRSTGGDLATELRVVAIELRGSVADLDSLADEVGQTRSTLAGSGDDSPVDLLPAQLMVAGFAMALIIQAIPLIREQGSSEGNS